MSGCRMPSAWIRSRGICRAANTQPGPASAATATTRRRHGKWQRIDTGITSMAEHRRTAAAAHPGRHYPVTESRARERPDGRDPTC